MMWTAEAIEGLKRLALEGRSASVIAALLGATSRNAVIGKANRIGIKLNGDGRASAPGRTQAVMQRVQLAPVPHPKPAPGKQSSAPGRSRDPRVKPAEKRDAGWSCAEAEVEEMRRVGFDEIRELICRWPLGDPMSRDFAYCGLKAAKGHSYCASHSRIAYRPPTARARQDPQERRWSPAVANLWRLR